MLKWKGIKGIKEWNNRRKKGLKNPIILWLWSLVLTFLLTVLPSNLISYISEEDRSGLCDFGIWIKVAVDNLYPMMITQTVVIILQNFGTISPPPDKDESKCYTFHFGWTVTLTVCLVVYIIIYLILILANPPKLNAILFAISGVLAVFGLISILQLDKEQEMNQKKYQEDQRAKELQNGERSLSGTDVFGVMPNADAALADTEDTKDRILV